MNLGLVDAQSFKGNLLLLPAVLAGTLIGRIVLKKIDQKLFETLALVLALAAGINLLYRSWGG